jgi:hypothetical protein
MTEKSERTLRREGFKEGAKVERELIIGRLIEFGALIPSKVAVGEGHYWLHTINGPIDVLLEDLETTTDIPE